MNVLKYINEHGFEYTAKIIDKYKIEDILNRIAYFFTKFLPLKNFIVIESHNDFDSNGGALYDYLIEHGYNKKYKIFWLLKNKKNKGLPSNVKAFYLYKPSIKKAIIIARAKYIFTCQDCIGSSRKDQISVYLTHGGFGLKRWRGKMRLPSNLTYVLMPSIQLNQIERFNYEIENKKVKSLILGYPEDDILYKPSNNELSKITSKKYKKVFLWMPTFRKTKDGRNDTSLKGGIGIPIFNKLDDVKKLNEELSKNNSLLIIKIHPMQDLKTVKIRELSNIIVLDGISVKKLNVDNYQLMKDTDALISDYSSAAYDYMHLNRPIGFTMDDVKDYKLGLIVDNPEKLIGGKIIKNNVEFLEFIQEVLDGKDTYKVKRNRVFDTVFDYHDGNSCERLVKFLKL